jgi:hypothetical protein
MKKLIRKIFRFALKEEIDRLNLKEKELDKRIEDAKIHLSQIREVLGNIDVSVDVHEYSKYSPSWAVISLQGRKADFIKFIELGDSSIHEIAQFLRRFERNHNIKVDASPRASQFLKFK